MRQVLKVLNAQFHVDLEEFNSSVNSPNPTRPKDVFDLVDKDASWLAKSDYWVVGGSHFSQVGVNILLNLTHQFWR